ncbi:MAG TPA: methyltransferase domain-containing protein [Candidatus Sulfomarinibacteraceae bacterium]|nr:methyltransferase domain-containing protein [Candidatus Sulfomarinibacteraceae bacterium]
MREKSLRTQLPLTCDDIVEEIACFAGISRQEAAHRVRREKERPGWNVLQDVLRFGVTAHRYDKQMERLYQEGEGFIFETLIFWARPNRRKWSQEALERLHRYARNNGVPAGKVRLLMLGDGSGNDSLFLAKHGFAVDYYDVPGSKIFEFATRRFEAYGLLGNKINLIADLPSCLTGKYDAVLSFEVLEHLSEPRAAIGQMAAALKPKGIALVTEDFGDLQDYLPTHLEATSKYFGLTPFLFLRHGLRLTWYSESELFRPSEYTKVRNVSIGDWISLYRDRVIRKRLYEGRVRQIQDWLAMRRPGKRES